MHFSKMLKLESFISLWLVCWSANIEVILNVPLSNWNVHNFFLKFSFPKRPSIKSQLKNIFTFLNAKCLYAV